jgi:hypothetical protein
VYRIPINDPEEAMKQYKDISTKMISEKTTEAFMLARDTAGFFRQPFLIGAHPLIEVVNDGKISNFKIDTNPGAVPNLITPRKEASPLQTPNNPRDLDLLMAEYKETQTQLQSTMQSVAIRVGHQEINPLWTINCNATAPFSVGEFLKPSKSGSMRTKMKPMKAKFSFDVRSLSNRKTLDIGYTTLFGNPAPPVEHQMSPDETTSDLMSESANEKTQFGTPIEDNLLTVNNNDNLGVFSESPTSFTYMNRDSRTDFDAFDTSLRNSLKHSVVDLNSRELMEFSIHKPSFPHIQYIHSLYVYPIVAQLKDISGASNVILEVLYRDEDKDVQISGNPNIVSPHDQLLRTFDVSSITLAEKSPQFFEEFKIELPVGIQSGQHLLFVLYNIDDEEFDKKKKKKKEKGAVYAPHREDMGNWERRILGYAILDLLEVIASEPKSTNEWETIAGSKIVDGVQKLTIFKNLEMHYLHATLDSHGSKTKLEVSTYLHSTLYPSDNIIHRFYCVLSEMERVHTQNQTTDKEMTNLIQVLKGFKTIDYTTCLPYASLILNTMFRLLATFNAFNLEQLDPATVESALFEGIVVFLRGIYLVTGKEFTRKNRTLLSYVQFIFNNCTEKIYGPLPAFAFIPKLYHQFLKNDKFNCAEFGQDEAPQSGKQEKKRGLFARSKKSVSVASNENLEPITERDALRFSWVFFDMVIKSLTLHFKGETKIAVTDYDELPGFERTGMVCC